MTAPSPARRKLGPLPSPLLRAALARHWRRHPWQLTLCLFGIALGVALVYAVSLANRSALASFEQALQQLDGRASHRLLGGPAGIDEDFYRRLRVELGLWRSAPLLLGRARLAATGSAADGSGGGDLRLRLLGVDPFAEPTLRGAQRSVLGGGAGGDNWTALLVADGGVALSAPLAARLGASVGDPLALRVGGRVVPARLALILRGQGPTAAALDELLITDIATAQRWLGRRGRLDRIDLLLPDGPPAALRALLDGADAAGLRLVEADARRAQRLQMSRAFRDSLRAMSLLALLVSGFLIYNASSLAALQRRERIGLLRGLGAERGAVFACLWGEALLLGAAGALLGLLLGQPLGQTLLGLVAQTMGDLYAAGGGAGSTGGGTLPDPATAIGASLLGMGASLLAALAPSVEAAASPPRLAQRRSVLERRGRRMAPWAALTGLLLGAAGLLLAAASESLNAGFAAALLVVLGYALLTPWLVLHSGRALAPLASRFGGALGRLGARGLADGLSRSAVAVAALSVAVAATVGIGLMTDSFRASLQQWLLQTLQADAYLSREGGAALDPQLPARLLALPQVAELSAGREVQVESERGPVALLALQPASRSGDGFALLAGDPQRVWADFASRRLLLISEPFARHQRLAVGDLLRLHTAAGAADFEIGGVFRDYASERGLLLLHRDHYRALWGDRQIGSIGIYLRAASGGGLGAAGMDAALAAIRGVAGEARLRASARIRELSMAVFERTFAVTEVLRLLTVLIAFAGILGALLALQLERGRDSAILRAVGATPGQIWRLVGGQTLLMGLLAGLLALPLGALLGELLIAVINPRAFGWTLARHYSPGLFAEALLLALAAAALAGIYPAWRAARAAPAEALRDE